MAAFYQGLSQHFMYQGYGSFKTLHKSVVVQTQIGVGTISQPSADHLSDLFQLVKEHGQLVPYSHDARIVGTN